MRGRGYTTVKGRQVHISVYLPVRQYSSLRAATRKTGLSIQQLVRHSLERVLKEVAHGPFDPRTGEHSYSTTRAAGGAEARAAIEGTAARVAHGKMLAGSLAAVRSSRELLRRASKT